MRMAAAQTTRGRRRARPALSVEAFGEGSSLARTASSTSLQRSDTGVDPSTVLTPRRTRGFVLPGRIVSKANQGSCTYVGHALPRRKGLG